VGLPVPPLVPPVFPAPAADDAAVKDEKVRASKLIHDHTGWRGHDAFVARGVMGAESGFDPNVDNGVCCIGLMQMNLNHAGSYGIPKDKEKAKAWLKDPVNNLTSAYKLWQDTGWSPTWDTYVNGSYRLHMNEDPLITVKKGSLSGGVVDTVGAAADAALGPLDELASTLLSKDTWFRVGKGVVGWNLLLIGTAGLALIVAVRVSKTAPVKSAVKVAKKIPPV
jgi:hypothetical protein